MKVKKSGNFLESRLKKQQSQELTASEQLRFEDESVEGTQSERTEGTQSMEVTVPMDGLRRGWEEVMASFKLG